MNALAAPNAFFVVSMVTIGSDGTVVVDAEGDGALGFFGVASFFGFLFRSGHMLFV